MDRSLRSGLTAVLVLALAGCASASPVWRHLSSVSGELPVPGGSQQQTGALVADLDGDGVSDFVLSFRQRAPALVWYRHDARGWTRRVIDDAFLTVEAGGAAYDIDRDGDLDIVFGGDWQSDELSWWENPAPDLDSGRNWTRHLIKHGGAKQHHDQIFGDFLGTGTSQLVFWNQGAKRLFLATIPADPRRARSWPTVEIFSGEATGGVAPYSEGLDAADVDGDGRLDLLAGNYWLRHVRGTTFRAVRIAPYGGRIRAGQLVKGGAPEVVVAPGDGTGPLRWFEARGDPSDTASWVGHDLVPGEVVHGHSLEVVDIDGDGNLDVFAAEMAKWSDGSPTADNPAARAWIFYGDGRGGFDTVPFATGIGFHEARIADFDGDGRLDVLDKPYGWETPRVDLWLQRGGRRR